MRDTTIPTDELYDQLKSEYDPVLDACLVGFADCEELIAQMLERHAEEADQKAEGLVLQRDLRVRSIVLREAALAVRLGQHRRG